MNSYWFLGVLVYVGVVLAGAAHAQVPPPPGPWAIKSGHLDGFHIGQPVVATTYFYWYDQPTGFHVVDPDGSDALTDHPVKVEGLSYRRIGWHERQLSDMMDAGIDILLPVYWGEPGERDSWSNNGLAPLVAARERLIAQGKEPPTIGMFYDTSTLQHNRQRRHVDLTTPAGHRWFYATVRDCFSLIPPQHRATIGGRPLVFLYSPHFAQKIDDQLFDRVREMFSVEFGADLYLVKMQGWPGAADATYMWGGAIRPRYLDVAAIGPGYDHSAVPGRTPLVRERERGAFYARSWEKLLVAPVADRPWLIHVETWNEFHEGTEICETREYGRHYIELTRKFADALHGRQQIEPEYLPAPVPQVTASPLASRGIQNLVLPDGDGPVRVKKVEGRAAWCTTPNHYSTKNRYLYFQVDPDFLLLGEPSVNMTISYYDRGATSFLLEYDSRDPGTSGLTQQFRPGHRQPIHGTGRWKEVSFEVLLPRFARRTNGADFRLTCTDGDLAVSSITVAHGYR